MLASVVTIPLSGVLGPVFVAFMFIIASLAVPYDSPFYYLKLSLWEIGWFLAGSLMPSVGLFAGLIGGAVAVFCMLVAVQPPILYLTLFFGGFGALALGTVL